MADDIWGGWDDVDAWDSSYDYSDSWETDSWYVDDSSWGDSTYIEGGWDDVDVWDNVWYDWDTNSQESYILDWAESNVQDDFFSTNTQYESVNDWSIENVLPTNEEGLWDYSDTGKYWDNVDYGEVFGIEMPTFELDENLWKPDQILAKQLELMDTDHKKSLLSKIGSYFGNNPELLNLLMKAGLAGITSGFGGAPSGYSSGSSGTIGSSGGVLEEEEEDDEATNTPGRDIAKASGGMARERAY